MRRSIAWPSSMGRGMARADLLLPPDLREDLAAFLEPRAAAVDAGAASVHEGIAFVADGVLAPAAGACSSAVPNNDLVRVAETIATVAWSDMSTAFSLWCQRMVLEYLSYAPEGSPPREVALPQLLRTERLGSTALASAMAHYVSGAPLPLTARREGNELVLNGRVPWASNLFQPAFYMVTAVIDADTGQPIFVAVPGDTPGLRIDPRPSLLALQATGSSSAVLDEARIGIDWCITTEFSHFSVRIRPIFLLLQSSFCWGLAHRALTEARASLRGINEVLRPDLDELEATAARLAPQIRHGLHDRQIQSTTRDAVQIRLDAARLATAAVALEAKALGGRGYVSASATARRLREAAFLPIQSPTEGQLRWELSRSA